MFLPVRLAWSAYLKRTQAYEMERPFCPLTHEDAMEVDPSPAGHNNEKLLEFNLVVICAQSYEH